MRRLGSGAGCGVPRACLASTPREAGGHRPGPLRGSAAIVRLDADSGRRGKPAGSCPGRTVPRPKITAVARPQAPRSIARWTASHPPSPRLSARRLPSWVRGENCRKPRAPGVARIRAAGCLTFEEEFCVTRGRSGLAQHVSARSTCIAQPRRLQLFLSQPRAIAALTRHHLVVLLEQQT